MRRRGPRGATRARETPPAGDTRRVRARASERMSSSTGARESERIHLSYPALRARFHGARLEAARGTYCSRVASWCSGHAALSTRVDVTCEGEEPRPAARSTRRPGPRGQRTGLHGRPSVLAQSAATFWRFSVPDGVVARSAAHGQVWTFHSKAMVATYNI